MTQVILPPVVEPDHTHSARLREIVERYRAARGPAMRALGLLGGQTDGILDRLPKSARAALDRATLSALELSFDTAARTRGRLPDTGTWQTRAMTVGTGAVGGFGGLGTALAEVPVTTTVILRGIQGIAQQHGFDPSHADTRLDCLEVFGAAGPLSEDDDTDLSFLTLRMTVTGATMQALLSKVAPRLALVLGQKLASQTVPILGAVTGAAINYTYSSYYQEMAHVSFGLRALAEETGQDRAGLVEEFRAEVLRLR